MSTEYVRSLEDRLIKAREQRDELLAALQAMVSFATKHPSKERNGALYDACAAIAKAQS